MRTGPIHPGTSLGGTRFAQGWLAGGLQLGSWLAWMRGITCWGRLLWDGVSRMDNPALATLGGSSWHDDEDEDDCPQPSLAEQAPGGGSCPPSAWAEGVGLSGTWGGPKGVGAAPDSG